MDTRSRWSSRFLLLGWPLALVPFALHTWFAVHGFFAQDDFVFINAAVSEPLSLRYLFQNHNGHIAPGAFGLVWLVTTLAPLNFVVAMLPLLAMQAATYVVLWRLLVRLFGARPGILAPFGVFTCSPLIHTPTLWWAYAVQLVPLLLALFLAVDAHVRHVQSGRTSSLLAALLWTVFGMAFYEKAVLFVFLLFGITLLLAPHHRLRPALSWTLRNHAATWLAHATLLAGYLTLYSSLATDQVRMNDVAFSAVPELAVRMLVDNLLVPSLGLPIYGVDGEGVPALVASSAAIRLIAVVATVLIVIVGYRAGGRRAILAWALLAGYLAADVAMVTVTRLPMLGPSIGGDMRYIADAVAVLALCVAFAYLRPIVSVAASEGTAEAAGADRALGLRWQKALAGVVVVATVGAAISSVRLAPNMLFPTSRQYVTNARAAVSQRPDLVLYDAAVPPAIMIGWFGEDRLASNVLSALPDPPRFDVPTEHMYVLDDQGRPQKITQLAFAVSTPPGPVEKCGYPVTLTPTVLPLPRTVRGKQLIRLSYYTKSGGTATVTAGKTDVRVRLKPGLHHVYVVAKGPFNSITVHDLASEHTLCIDKAVVGVPALVWNNRGS